MNGMTYCFKPNQERSSCSFHGRKNTQCTGQKPVGIRQKQKSSPDKSDELEYDGLIISKLDSDLSVPHVAGWIWHLVPLFVDQVVKASQGHYPQPFLISK